MRKYLKFFNKIRNLHKLSILNLLGMALFIQACSNSRFGNNLENNFGDVNQEAKQMSVDKIEKENQNNIIKKKIK